MPRKIIDYSNTIIYKICCKDPSITDVYVGHTTNFTNRKRNHKVNCNNENIKCYNYYVYQFIRDHGGWDNWSMVELLTVKCIDRKEALQYEQQYINKYKSSLNKIKSLRTEDEKNEMDIYFKSYYIDNRNKIIEEQKKYNLENREKIKEYKRKYYQLNKEKCQEANKLWKQNNKSKITSI